MNDKANRISASDETTTEAMGIVPFSRRTFFQLSASVGALTFLGSALGGRIHAYADEVGNQSFVVYVLSKEEVPVMVVDVSKDPVVAVPNAQVTITSNVTPNESPVVVTTDSDGFAPANVRKLSYQRDDDTSSIYNFFGAVSLSKDGYRTCYQNACFIEAGTPADSEGNRTNTIQIPTQPIDNKPYLRQFSMDDADIQYAKDVKAPAWSGNEADHSVLVEVITPQAGQTVNITVEAGGVKEGPVQETSSSTFPYSAKHTFTRKWLQEVSVGSSMTVTFGINGGDSYTFTSPLEFFEPLLFEGGKELNDAEGSFSPGLDPDNSETYAALLGTTDSNGSNTCPLPDWMQRVGPSMLISCPLLPIKVFCDQNCNFGVTVDLFKINFLKQRDGVDVLASQASRYENVFSHSLKENWDNYVKETEARSKKVEDIYNEDIANPKKFGMSKFTSKLDCSFDVQLALGGKISIPDSAEKFAKYTTQTTLYGYIVPEFNFSLLVEETFVVVYVPFIVSFDFAAKIAAKLGIGWKYYGWFHEGQFNFTGCGCIIDFTIDIGLTVGIGISGIVSVGVRGYGQIGVEIGLVKTEKEGQAFPHLTTKTGLGLQVVVQFLFYKQAFDCIPLKMQTMYDNWGNTSSVNNIDTGYTGLPKLSEENMTLVTDLDLATHAEAIGTWIATGSTGTLAPTYGVIKRDNSMAACTSAGVVDLLNASNSTLRAINGLKPADVHLLYEGSYSNPRMRIVHTDAKSFSQDRAFMVRIITAKIEAPNSTAAFSSSVTYKGKPVSSSDSLIVNNIHGNLFVVPASKAAKATDATDDVYRTRLAVSEWDKDKMSWGDAYTIDFSVPGEIDELDRINSHDLDFDVDLYDGQLLIAITSIQRPDTSSASLADYDGNQFLSLVRYDIDQHKVVSGGSTFSSLASGLSLSHPHILVQSFDEGNGAGATQHCIVYSYASTFNSEGKRTKAYIAATVFDDMKAGYSTSHRYSAPTLLECKELSNLDPDTLASGTFEVSCPDRTLTYKDTESNRMQTTVMIAWSHAETETTLRVSYTFLQTFSIVKKDSSDGSTSFEPHVINHDSKRLEDVGYMTKLGRSNQSAVFSYPDTSKETDKKPLGMITFDAENWKLGIIEDTGETSKDQYFSSWNGRRIYCVRTMKGKAPGFTESTQKAVESGIPAYSPVGPYNVPVNDYSTEERDVELYQLLEARWVDGANSYFDFYPIAQIPFIPDNIGVIAAAKNCTVFTFAEISLDDDDASKDKCDIYQVNVPVVMSADLNNTRSASPFTAPGDNCYYLCEVSNCGNAPITSITMKVSSNGKDVQEITFDDLSKVMQQSADDVKPQLNNGELMVNEFGLIDSNVEFNEITAAGILWPGTTRTFKFYFTVPKDTETGKKVQFDVVITAVADHMDDDSRFSSLTTASTTRSIPLMAADAYVSNAVYSTSTQLCKTPVGMNVTIAGNTTVKSTSVSSADYSVAR